MNFFGDNYIWSKLDSPNSDLLKFIFVILLFIEFNVFPSYKTKTFEFDFVINFPYLAIVIWYLKLDQIDPFK